MRIGIDYTSAVHQTAGIGRRTREVVAAIAGLNAQREHDFRLFVQAARRSELPPTPGEGFSFHPFPLSERNFARIWHRLNLPAPRPTWWTGPVDVFHAPDFMLPPLPGGLPSLLTIHDLSFVHAPETFVPGMRTLLGAAVPRSVRRATHVIAVSEATKQDLVNLYGTLPEKISVIYAGVQPHFRPIEDTLAIRTRYGLSDAPFILTVGTLQPRKNHLRLVQAFVRMDAPDHKLVIAGGKGWIYDEVRAEVERLGLAGRVLFPGFVADEDLPALYSAAEMFVYPSLYEGFGLPVLEAMACGTPVVTSDTSSLPEVVAGGEAGLMVNPLDVDALAEAMGRLLLDATLRANLIEKGRAQAAGFTWEKTARQTLALYEHLAGA